MFNITTKPQSKINPIAFEQYMYVYIYTIIW